MKNYLAISTLGKNYPNLIEELSRTILECDCSIENSRMMALGNEFAIVLMVQGNWNTLTRLEAQLKRMENTLDIKITTKRTEARTYSDNALPYTVEIVSMKHPGIVHNLAKFFASRSISIEELTTHVYSAPHTGTIMFSATMILGIPADIYIAMLREEFMDFCDELNLDAVMEPIKR